MELILYRRAARQHGRDLARRIRESLVWRSNWGLLRSDFHPGMEWELSGSPEAGTSILAKRYLRLTIRPNKWFPAIRILDQVRLAHAGCDVWLPLWQRLRLKNAARLHITLRALTDRPAPYAATQEAPG